MIKYSSFLITLFCLLGNVSFAQFYIQSGAAVTCLGSPTITLQNEDLQVLGTFTPATSTVLMNGTSNSTISFSTSPLIFNNLEIAKTSGGGVSSSSNGTIQINGNVTLNGGIFQLNTSTLDLYNANSLIQNENENNRITATTGAIKRVHDFSTAPTNINAGNIGLDITATQALGTLTILRKSTPATGAGGSGINRVFEVDAPTAPTNLNATLKINYLDAELNGVPEAALQFWQDPIGTIGWTNLGVTSSNTTTNFVSFNDVDNLNGSFTLAAASVLPVELLTFKAAPIPSFGGQGAGGNLLTWTTGEEKNVLTIEIERSSDGLIFEKIGVVKSSGSNSKYEFIDQNPLPNINYYRLKINDLDGSFSFSKIESVNMSKINWALQIAPNPFSDVLTVALQTDISNALTINLYDLYGRNVFSKIVTDKTQLTPLSISTHDLPVGVYFVEISNGAKKEVRKVVKH